MVKGVGGVWLNLLKKRKICNENLFLYNNELSSKKLEKMISADIRAATVNIKQQETKNSGCIKN